MPQPDLTPTIQSITDAVTRVRGQIDSTIAFINGVGAKISAAVTAALEADDAADQGTIDAAKAAIDGQLAELNASADALAAAVAANP